MRSKPPSERVGDGRRGERLGAAARANCQLCTIGLVRLVQVEGHWGFGALGESLRRRARRGLQGVCVRVRVGARARFSSIWPPRRNTDRLNLRFGVASGDGLGWAVRCCSAGAHADSGIGNGELWARKSPWLTPVGPSVTHCPFPSLGARTRASDCCGGVVRKSHTGPSSLPHHGRRRRPKAALREGSGPGSVRVFGPVVLGRSIVLSVGQGLCRLRRLVAGLG